MRSEQDCENATNREPDENDSKFRRKRSEPCRETGSTLSGPSLAYESASKTANQLQRAERRGDSTS